MSDFTTAQQAQIRAVLGYPSLFRYKDTRLEGVIAGTGILDADTIALVVGWLGTLTTLDAKILGVPVDSAGVKVVEEIELFEGRAKKDIWDIGRTYITRISTALGVPTYSDYYGASGYPGDKYSSEGLGRPGGGNIIPLG